MRKEHKTREGEAFQESCASWPHSENLALLAAERRKLSSALKARGKRFNSVLEMLPRELGAFAR